MIHIEENIKEYNSCQTMQLQLAGANSKKEKIDRAIELVKTLPIEGCITGSCWLPDFDPDGWGSTPDIDVFVYSEYDLIKAITLAEHALRMEPGTGTERSNRQERWKIDRLYTSGLNYKLGITTYKFYCNGIILNFTFKQYKDHGRWLPCNNAQAVLQSFDLSIVMQGYDIGSHVMFDFRPDNVDVKTAIPNPLRKIDYMVWTVNRWVRQFDRVVKYYERGYDTRPMAEAYIKMIDDCINTGNLFDTENSNEVYDSFTSDFLDKREQINDWLEDHKED